MEYRGLRKKIRRDILDHVSKTGNIHLDGMFFIFPWLDRERLMNSRLEFERGTTFDITRRYNHNAETCSWINAMHYGGKEEYLWRKYPIRRGNGIVQRCIMDVFEDLLERDLVEAGMTRTDERLSPRLISPKRVLQAYSDRVRLRDIEDGIGSEEPFRNEGNGVPDEIWDIWPEKLADMPDVRLIRTVGELAKESKDMGHCVWDYVSVICKREIAVFHLSLGQGEGTTLGLAWPSGEPVHHNGKNNRGPNAGERKIEMILSRMVRLAAEEYQRRGTLEVTVTLPFNPGIETLIQTWLPRTNTSVGAWTVDDTSSKI